MAVEYTESQRSAIESRGCSLIVSAAAGSGKTAVLVERVIGLICDRESPCDIDRLLVVTFTNAAASEMREKISAALLKRITSEPGNLRLRRQLSLLSGARIQTVHSFCLDLVREHFAICGVPADFALADSARAGELRRQALEETLEELYLEGSGDFSALCSALSEEKGDKVLESVIDEIYDKLTSHPDSQKTLEYFTSAESQDNWQGYLLAWCRDMIDNGAARLKAALDYMECNQAVYEKYKTAFSACLDFAKRAQAALDDGWDRACQVFDGFSNPRLAAVKGEENKEMADYMKAAKQDFVDTVAYIKEKALVMTEEEACFGREENLSALRGLRVAVCRYMERYSQIKLSRKLLDFSDLEHYALRLLRDDEGEPTPLGLEISEGIDEVLVDEYQDTNDIQEAIFRVAAARAKSSFYVGDVKQSIYRFRMAKPEIFMEKYLGYEDFEYGARGKNIRLPLNKNFRSRREILDTCNHVFGAIMTREFGDIDYTEEEALHCGAPYEGKKKTHFEIIDMQGASDDDDSPEKAEAEAVYTANTIVEMMKNEVVTNPFTGEVRKAEYKDFAVLLSSFANKSGYFIKELERLGIPVNGGQRDFWNSMEILVMMSFLRVLDNRRQDIPLVGLMRSPLFFFSPDHLAEIRLEARDAIFFDALVRCAQKGDEKCAAFIRLLEKYVSYVADTPPSQIISMIYSEQSVIAVFGAMDSGQERQENLRAFYNMALEYEGTGSRTLFDFISYAENMMEQGSSPPTEEGDGVRIMSIHKSKGLEFPFVFLPDLNKNFNFDDAKSPVIVHDRMGIGMKIRMRQSRAEYRMPMHMAVAAAVRRELASEEVRKLYVAMTRAKERLIMVAGVKNAGKMIEDISRDVQLGGISPIWLSMKSNAAAWLIAAFMQKPCRSLTHAITPYSAISRLPASRIKQGHRQAAKADKELLDMLERSGEGYAYAHLSALPSKLTPAGARRLLEDAGVVDSQDGKAFVELFPRESSKLRSGLTAAQRGSAVHLFMQKARLEKCFDNEDITAQIKEMENLGILSRQEAEAVEPSMIAAFAHSTWGKAAAVTSRVVREYEFSALVSPAELGLNDDEGQDILMNGVIDMMIMENDGITIVDFKTDRVAAGGEAQAAKRHKLQLDIYALSAEKIFGLSVKEKVVFFLRSGVGCRV